MLGKDDLHHMGIIRNGQATQLAASGITSTPLLSLKIFCTTFSATVSTFCIGSRNLSGTSIVFVIFVCTQLGHTHIVRTFGASYWVTSSPARPSWKASAAALVQL